MKKIQTIIALLLLWAGHAAAQTTEYDTDRGFVHPGGLHTQADFERVRQQIASGNEKVMQAYEVLKNSEYAQSSVRSNPTETIVRGGNGENYMNAARGASMAYQNALRWKIEGNVACADNAVKILMDWARTTKSIGGDSNYALASGIYGYEFAQAAELMRDYEGWNREDFEQYKKWMLSVWYQAAIGFLRVRNGTWENSGRWWQAPGHYWSNWGLCNALCIISIGILCDDVFIYNQGMSYIKYDQCGTFKSTRTEVPIKNDGLTEFMGYFVVTTQESELETGAYGMLGQLNESGRDAGHSAMSLGLMVDVAKVAWNQGDDLFAYMDHRLAAGIEYLAAQTLSVAGLPWVDYIYGSSGYYYTDSRAWTMTEPAMGAHTRPYWGTVIGIYESIKGVTMPFSEQAYQNMGIDGGAAGSTSGGYDHLGFSVLMNTHDVQLCPEDKRPTELTPLMEYSGQITGSLIPSPAVERELGNIDGQTIRHNELGGLVNTYKVNTNTCVPSGQSVTLIPLLPEGEEDTGRWKWDTGETSRSISVSSDRSYVYRVIYTNSRGAESRLSFFVAAKGDNTGTDLTPQVIYNGKTTETTTMNVLYGKSCELSVTPSVGWGTYWWSSGEITQKITTAAIRSEQEYTVTYTNQSGCETNCSFHLIPIPAEQYITVNGVQKDATEAIVSVGSDVVLGLNLPSGVLSMNVEWSNGNKGSKLTLDDIQESGEYTATFSLRGETITVAFRVLVNTAAPAIIEEGNYIILETATGRLLTAPSEQGQAASFEEGNTAEPLPGQTWFITNRNDKHMIVSLADSLVLTSLAKLSTTNLYLFYIEKPAGMDDVSLHTGTGTNCKYWAVNPDGSVNLNTGSTLTDYPFTLIPIVDATGIDCTKTIRRDAALYDLSGRRVAGNNPSEGIYVSSGKKLFVKPK